MQPSIDTLRMLLDGPVLRSSLTPDQRAELAHWLDRSVVQLRAGLYFITDSGRRILDDAAPARAAPHTSSTSATPTSTAARASGKHQMIYAVPPRHAPRS